MPKEEIDKHIKRIEQKRDEKSEQETIKLMRDFDDVFSSESGKIVLKYINKICGFDTPSLVVNKQTGDICKEAVIYNEARRNVYLEIRSLLRPKVLKEVEYDDI